MDEPRLVKSPFLTLISLFAMYQYLKVILRKRRHTLLGKAHTKV